MLTVHHLGVSQSERIHWLCEELGIPYEFKRYDRDPETKMAHPFFKAATPMGAAPVITDGDLVLGESGAIMDYIIGKYGNGRLALGPSDPHYADYLYWYHFANGTMMPRASGPFMLERGGVKADTQVHQWLTARASAAYQLIEDRLGKVPYLAGPAFTAADIMNFFALTTARAFFKRDLSSSPNTRAYLKRVGERPAYRKAMAMGDPGMSPLLD